MLRKKTVTKCLACGTHTTEIKDPQFDLLYDYCPHCLFTQKQSQFHLNTADEKDQYDRHQNSFDNAGYVAMLQTFLDQSVLPHKSQGNALDFGSGPGPVLFELLKHNGFKAFHFDLFYHNDLNVWDRHYAVITSTEVFEHLADPNHVFSQLYHHLEPGGILAIMTLFRPEKSEAFNTWWYRRDPTHISFYTEKALRYFADNHGFKKVNTNHKNMMTLMKVM